MSRFNSGCSASPLEIIPTMYYRKRVDKMNSFISWIGGKKLLKRKIMEQFPKNFDRYIEVFGGAGWVLFDKEKHADMEVYNDVNGELVNLFRCVKYHPDALQKELDWTLISREQFFNCVAQNEIQGMTDIQRAARFYCRIKLSFGADLDSFGVRPRNMQKTIIVLLTTIFLCLKSMWSSWMTCRHMTRICTVWQGKGGSE